MVASDQPEEYEPGIISSVNVGARKLRRGGFVAEDRDHQPEAAGTDARGSVLFGGGGADWEDNLCFWSSLDGCRRERGRRRRYKAPDADGARAREDRGRGGRWRDGRHSQGNRLHKGHAALR